MRQRLPKYVLRLAREQLREDDEVSEQEDFANAVGAAKRKWTIYLIIVVLLWLFCMAFLVRW